MTISGTLANRDEIKKVTLKEGAHKSLQLIDKKPFYIEPLVSEIQVKSNARFILFSAPGASGKSALAKYFSYVYKALYWDLSAIRLGDSTFVGTLLESIEDDEFQAFMSDLQLGKSMLIVDALDEAILVSGSSNVENLVNDLAKYTKKANKPTIILFARTETATRIADYCVNKLGIVLNHYEISYIPEDNAKNFIKESLKGKNNVDLVTQCIEEQFRIIRQILQDEDTCKFFLGYAPVLQAICSAYDKENNTIKLLNKLKMQGSIGGTKIIYSILNFLLRREQDKVIEALKRRWEKTYSDFEDWEDLYTEREQVIRIMEYVHAGTFDLYENEIISGINDIKQDYIEVLKQFMPEHPFIRRPYDGDLSFAGPAFRDYVIATCLADDDYRILAEDYCSTNAKSLQVPSQMVFDFYLEYAADVVLAGQDFNLLYGSFKAKEKNGIKGYIDIVDDECSYNAYFGLYDEMKDKKAEESSPIKFNRKNELEIINISNAKVDVKGNIKIGRKDSSVFLLNSVISGEVITFDASEVYIKSKDFSNCILISNNPVKFSSSYPKFIVEEDVPQKVKISFPNIKNFSSLRKHEFSIGADGYSDGLIRFAMVVDKILDCMRKHKKDAPAKEMDYIEHEVIAQSAFKKKVLQCLLNTGVIFVDNEERHLYKLDGDMLSKYNIGWQMFARHGEKPFEKLYKVFREM